jgi:glycine cleavage system H protein
MSEIPPRLKYTPTHEWIREESDGTVTVGITDHAQHLLGELVYVELPKSNQHYAAQDPCCVVESVKAASDVYCPIAGTVMAINEQLGQSPEAVNQSSYDQGWLFRMKPDAAVEGAGLLSADAYHALVEHEGA